ncbi:MAG: site-specific integrase, partial [Candidatus Helarchaeota archaeon]
DMRYELAFLLIYETGIRPHELLSVRLKDVEVRSDGRLFLSIPEKNPQVPSGRNKTGARTVVVDQNARQLREYCDKLRNSCTNQAVRHADGMRLFPFKYGALSVAFCLRKARQYSEASDNDPVFKGRLYDLSHTAITNYYLRGFPDQVVKKLVGWAPSSSMLDIYVHVKMGYVINYYNKSYHKGNGSPIPIEPDFSAL